MRRLRFILALPLLLVSQLAHAGYSPIGYVSNISVNYDGIVHFDADSKIGSPACQSSTSPKSYAFDATNASGQAKLALLLSANSLHKRVFIGGTSLCSNQADLETVNFLSVEN